VSGEFVLYAVTMVQVFIADSLPDERAALRLLVQDLKMNVIGEASDWVATLADAPRTGMEMLLVDWGLLPKDAMAALTELRNACPKAIVIVLISHLDARVQAARTAGADDFISKSETPDRVSKHLRTAAGRIRAGLAQPDQNI
jgi:DNA-binding NarL/FixJ family response regulator